MTGPLSEKKEGEKSDDVLYGRIRSATRSQPSKDHPGLPEIRHHFQQTFPEIKFIGFFARDILLGPRPQYFALWEVPDYATLDTWKRAFSADKHGRKISNELNELGMNWDAKMVSKIDLG
ncbi:MAG: hypothetical protein V3U33_01255 [candidate division NC10 bacterium]